MLFEIYLFVGICKNTHNAFILSKFLAYKEKLGDQEISSLLKQISPVAWQHINLQGCYQFNNQPTSIDLDTIIHKLAKAILPNSHLK